MRPEAAFPPYSRVLGVRDGETGERKSEVPGRWLESKRREHLSSDADADADACDNDRADHHSDVSAIRPRELRRLSCLSTKTISEDDLEGIHS